jgi:N-methylhydantoinase A
LIAFGGAAPLHVTRIAQKSGISRILVPEGAGVGSAVGFLVAPISYEVARSFYLRLASFAPERLNAVLAAMAEEARGVVARGVHGEPLTEHRTAFARYVGQGHEIPVPVPVRDLALNDGAKLRSAFEDAYMEQYGRLIQGVDIEILAWTVRVGTATLEVPRLAPVTRRSTPVPATWREVFDTAEGQFLRTAIYRRAELPSGSTLTGPAIIAEESTSTVIGPGYEVLVEADNTIVITRRES